MADSPRVAVYLDFDNIVISLYDHVFGKGSWHGDEARQHGSAASTPDPIDARLARARVNIGAIIEYASSFGTVAMTRAYADWSVPANASYRRQLVDRAVDLVQLFPASGTKNGADIRLAIDAMNDLHQHADLTHVVIVAGDSDYIALAQRCKQLGRYVVGVGVTGSTSRALVAACDVFIDYARIPGVTDLVVEKPAPTESKPAAAKKTAKKAASSKKASPAKKAAKKAAKSTDPAQAKAAEQDERATALLVRAVRLGLKNSDDEWVYSSGVKSQMQRMDSTFDEKALGFSSFRAFVESRSAAVESGVVNNGQLRVRLR